MLPEKQPSKPASCSASLTVAELDQSKTTVLNTVGSNPRPVLCANCFSPPLDKLLNLQSIPRQTFIAFIVGHHFLSNFSRRMRKPPNPRNTGPDCVERGVVTRFVPLDHVFANERCKLRCAFQLGLLTVGDKLQRGQRSAQAFSIHHNRFALDEAATARWFRR